MIKLNPTTCYQSALLVFFLLMNEIERLIHDMVLADQNTEYRVKTLIKVFVDNTE